MNGDDRQDDLDSRGFAYSWLGGRSGKWFELFLCVACIYPVYPVYPCLRLLEERERVDSCALASVGWSFLTSMEMIDRMILILEVLRVAGFGEGVLTWMQMMDKMGKLG